MMMITSPENPRNETIPYAEPIITSTTCPSWKLYENPFYNFQQGCESNQHLDHLHHPLSARKLAASFWDLTFLRTTMRSELELARAQIIDMKAKLDCERKARRKLESLNKKLGKELDQERRGKEALERVVETFAEEIFSNKAEIARMKREMEKERKMLRMAEALREERVQMKLNEAKILFEEKLLEFQDRERMQIDSKIKQKDQQDSALIRSKRSMTVSSDLRSGDNDDVDSRETPTWFLCHEPAPIDHNESTLRGLPRSILGDKATVSCVAVRRASPEPENHHIKRGIKGLVEFPRVVRASKTRHLGNKLGCQKAQIRFLLKQPCPIGFNNLIMS